MVDDWPENYMDPRELPPRVFGLILIDWFEQEEYIDSDVAENYREEFLTPHDILEANQMTHTLIQDVSDDPTTDFEIGDPASKLTVPRDLMEQIPDG